jgi:hypothetical protein
MFIYTIGDILTLLVIVLTIATIIVVGVIQWYKQSRCKHDGGYNETQACDAICRQCGKNLGFIGKLRDNK